MIALLGILLIISGIAIIVLGDKYITKSKGGIIQKIISPPITNRNRAITINIKLLKWVVGILCVWFGVDLLIDGRL